MIGVVGTLAIVAIANSATRGATGKPAYAELRFWLLILVLLATVAYACWFSVRPRPKRVAVDGSALYVSNYLREITVPPGDIEHVTEGRWLNARLVTVHFSRETEFGSATVFWPKARRFGAFGPHPIVAELGAAAQRARGSTSDRPAA
jgi:hypothetical protein